MKSDREDLENVNSHAPQINEESIEKNENIDENKKKEDIKKLLNDIQNLIKLDKNLVERMQALGIESTTIDSVGTENTTTESIVSITECLTKTLSNLTLINGIKQQLCLLPLDFCTINYYNNCVFPFVTTLDFLSRTSFNLSTSVSALTSSPIVPVKRSDIKDTIELIYDINEQCEDVYKVARKNINTMIECNKC